MRISKFNKNLALATARHSLLLESNADKAQNRISAKTHLNSYCFRGRKLITENERLEAYKYVESFFTNDNNQFDNIRYSKTKSKLRKWCDAATLPKSEKEFYLLLLEQTEVSKDKKFKRATLLDRLNGLNHKVKRYNDKKRAIEDLCDLHNQRTSLDIDSSNQLEIRVVETLFKIPLHNDCELDVEIQEEILQAYYKQHFPNYELFLSVLHRDEIGDHIHAFVDAKNNETGYCDFVQYNHDYAKQKFGLHDYPIKYSKCSSAQVSHLNSLLQDDFYAFTNEFLESKNLPFKFGKKVLDEEERELRVSIKIDSSKRMADREFNTANYLTKKNLALANQIDEQKAEIRNLRTIFKGLIKKVVSYVNDILKADAELDSQSFSERASDMANDYSSDTKDIYIPALKAEKSVGKNYLRDAVRKKKLSI